MNRTARSRGPVITLLLAAVLAAGLTVVRAQPAEAAGGCNGEVCVTVNATGTYVRSIKVFSRNAPQDFYKGHHDILIPVPPHRYNGREGWGPPTLEKVINRHYPNGSRVCGEGWTYRSGRWDLTGRPCVTIHR